MGFELRRQMTLNFSCGDDKVGFDSHLIDILKFGGHFPFLDVLIEDSQSKGLIQVLLFFQAL
jgi:tRNA G26 N,N-dimethylase Trm1